MTPPDTEGLIPHSGLRCPISVDSVYRAENPEAGIEPSVRNIGDSYDNAMAESVIGLFKTEVIRSQGRTGEVLTM